MPSDAPQFNPKPKQKSLESLKATFKQKLDSILNKQLNVENIETFADEALDQTIKLTEDISTEYETNGALNAGPASMREKEDFAFSALELPNLQEVLQSIMDVKEKIDRIRKDISEANITADKVFIPPQHDSSITLNNGTGQGIEEKKLIPRLLTLLYILETDFDIKKEQVKITEGKVTPEMVRQTPYVRVEVEDMGRIIYICDEEGNASYVFDIGKLKESGIDPETLDVSDKGAINDLIAKHPGIGIRIIQTTNWRTNMSKVLKNPIPEKIPEENLEKQPVLEFAKRERKSFLPFDDFRKEVKSLYPGKGKIIEWYEKERLDPDHSHLNWPVAPNLVYKGKGWLSWNEIMGKKPRYGKEYPAFSIFKAEVKSFYKGETDVSGWYNVERKNHPNWPFDAGGFYKNQGFIGYPELVGKENRLRKEYLSFNNFKKEVKTLYALYAGEDNTAEWYKKEKENHPNWPTTPHKFYKDSGWQGWPKLFG